jgi:hypothetical protein
MGGGSPVRSPRKGIAALAAIVVTVVALVGGVVIGVAGPGLFARATARVIYVYPTSSPSILSSSTVSDTGTPSATASASPSGSAVGPSAATASASALTPTPAATSTATLGPTATATQTATPRPTASPTPALPDLYVSLSGSFAIVCTVPFDVDLEVFNGGSGPSPASEIRLVDTYSGITDLYADGSVPALAAGSNTWVHFREAISEGCGVTHHFTAIVDPDDHIPESQDGNNATGTSFTPVAKPNLTLQELTVPSGIACNVGYEITVVVMNNTAVPTPRDSLVKFSDVYGGVAQHTVYTSFPALPAHTGRRVHAVLRSDTYCGLMHQLVVVADDPNLIDESFETDNSVSTPFAVHS